LHFNFPPITPLTEYIFREKFEEKRNNYTNETPIKGKGAMTGHVKKFRNR